MRKLLEGPGEFPKKEPPVTSGKSFGSEMRLSEVSVARFSSAESDALYSEASSIDQKQEEATIQSLESATEDAVARQSVPLDNATTSSISNGHSEQNWDVGVTRDGDKNDADKEGLIPACHKGQAGKGVLLTGNIGPPTDHPPEENERHHKPLRNGIQTPLVVNDVDTDGGKQCIAQDSSGIAMKSQTRPCSREGPAHEETGPMPPRDPHAWRHIVHVEQQKARVLAAQLDAACAELKVFCDNAACSKELLHELKQEWKQHACIHARAPSSAPPLDMHEQVRT